MKLTALLLAALLLTASAFAQVQVLWDVPLNIPVANDSSRHMRIFPDRTLAAWGSRNLAVFDTLGQLEWQWNTPLVVGMTDILDVEWLGGEIFVAYREGVGMDSTDWLARQTRFSAEGDSLDTYTLHLEGLRPDIAAIGGALTAFASLTDLSLAPHGMLTAMSNAGNTLGDSLWTIEVLPYTMDNVNSFTSLRETANSQWALTGTYGLPGQGLNTLAIVTNAGEIYQRVPMGLLSDWRLFDALEVSPGHLWVVGVHEANVSRWLMLYDYQTSGPWIYRPLAQYIEFFEENAAVPASEGGLLLAGHIGGHDTASRVFLMRISGATDTLWTTTLPLYNRFTDVDADYYHPGGGYLALAIDYSGASYHLVRFIETTAGTINGAVLLPASYSLSAYPNPFNPSTKLSFTVPESEKISLRIYDLLGQEVATLFEGMVTAGTYSFSWNAKDQSAGVYFARLQSGKRALTQKLLLLK